MAHQTDTKQSADGQLSVQQSAPGLTVVHSVSQPTRTKTDGLQVVISPGMVYMVEADPPSTARVGCHRRPTPIKPPRAQRAGHLLRPWPASLSSSPASRSSRGRWRISEPAWHAFDFHPAGAVAQPRGEVLVPGRGTQD